MRSASELSERRLNARNDLQAIAVVLALALAISASWIQEKEAQGTNDGPKDKAPTLTIPTLQRSETIFDRLRLPSSRP